MEFLTQGQKIRKLRKMLNMTQLDLQSEGIKRNSISMIENGERGMSKETATYLAERFNNRASELGIKLNIDATYLLESQKIAASRYCLAKLEKDLQVEELNEIIEIAINFSLKEIEALAYKKRGNVYYNERDYSKALIAYIEAINIYSNIEDQKNIAYLFNKLGLCKLNDLYYSDALEFFNKANSIAIVIDHLETKKNSTYNIALCYRKLGEYQESLKFIDEYLTLCDKNTEFTNFIYAMVIKANCYRDLCNYKNAKSIYNHLIENINIQNDLLNVYVYENLGLLYANMQEYEKAIFYLDISIDLRKKSDIPNLCRSLIDKADILVKQNKYDEAIPLIDSGIDIAQRHNDREYELKGYYLLSNVYKKDETKLEKIYLKIYDTIKEKKDYKEMCCISNKLCLLYLQNNKTEKAVKFLKFVEL